MPPIPRPRPRRKTFLREWREFRRLTQEQAGIRLGIDRTTLSRIERGLVPYNQGLLESAADVYICEPADLIMCDPRSQIWSIFNTLRSLPEQKQEHIKAIIETFAKAS